MKYPEEFTSSDWTKYLVGSLKRRRNIEFTIPVLEKKAWETGLGKISKDSDPYVLAIAIDLIAINWESVKNENVYSITTPGFLFFRTRSMNKTKEWFRGAFFCRFAKDEHEIRWFITTLDHLEDAKSSPTGIYLVNDANKEINRLRIAEKKIRDRNEIPLFLWEPFGK